MMFRPPPSSLVRMPNQLPDEAFTPEVLEGFIDKVISPEMEPVANRFAKFLYIDGKGNPRNTSFILQQFNELQNDVMFHVPAYSEAMLRTARQAKTWLYSFDYYSENLFDKSFPWKGALHATELLFQFKVNFTGWFEFPWTPEDHKMSEKLLTLWTNFAKFGNPTPEPINGVTWPELSTTSGSTDPHLRIDSKLSVSHFFHREATQFWLKLRPLLAQLASSASSTIQNSATSSEHTEL